MSERVRIDRFLAKEGLGSRADVKKIIRSGGVFVNNQAVVSGDMKIDPDLDEVIANGKRVRRMAFVTIMLNKPSGVVSATKDGRFRTVTDLIREPWAEGLFPVGRLDKDTEGLLLLTKDGDLCHALLSPRKHVPKTYFAVISGMPDPGIAEEFREGIEIGDQKKTLPARLSFLSRNPCGSGLKAAQAEKTILLGSGSIQPSDPRIAGLGSIRPEDYERCGEEECCAVVTITEGRFHQIKRMFGAFGREVHFLKRISMGALALDPALGPGQYRMLSAEEMELLRAGGTEKI